ncbi:Flp family type IVb pilin [Aestuariivirga sp. YIM B02566]|jgi:pilus assembly protein Flp/PilA|uniref:Flp family type IVb pilin n=1 Tax=Taklimakanibacter albus TaxID=2800327 RepID=A0ACC5RE93_9HYPH|nr:Flp family type IVb pilin [Aestuariivirga sp. YIM B02566]MBK1870917.1 Flp family type IVb pilin [Aestuariivirga sp. YIM B02566]
MNTLMRFVKDESGATAIEYGLIAAAIGLMLVAVLPGLRTALSGVYTGITTGVGTVSP